VPVSAIIFDEFANPTYSEGYVVDKQSIIGPDGGDKPPRENRSGRNVAFSFDKYYEPFRHRDCS
jgi:hypothetical protein